MLLAMPGANVMRYDGARTATVVGGWSEDGELTLPLGSTFDLDGDTVVAKVLRCGTPQRVDRYEGTSGNLAETMQRSGYRAAVAAPVTVAGRLWGALAAGTRSTSRCQRASSSNCATSRTWSHSRSRMPTPIRT